MVSYFYYFTNQIEMKKALRETKFEADSYLRSKVIRGPKISKLGHVTQTTST